MELNATTILVTFTGVFLICFMKGAFGGGFAIVGIPLLSLVMDPVTAGGLLAPLFVAMDLFSLRYWKPSTWSKPDLILLVPGLGIGIALGYVLFRVLDHRAIAIVMAAVTLILWACGLSAVARQSYGHVRRPGRRRRRDVGHHDHGGALWRPTIGDVPATARTWQQVYAGTTSMFFTVGNFLKAVLGWRWRARRNPWTLMAICLPAVPLASGWVGACMAGWTRSRCTGPATACWC
jgi:uncharacterized membrane protein YfcA